MLQPREADVPVLFLVFVVLPLVTYILLGIWNETSKKKARISVLAQRAAEEALRIEEMASVDVLPATSSLSTGYYECARCFAPATTRCSRCKSVRYCSGKCQIMHWRQGHKQECQQWQDNHLNFSAGQSVAGEAQWKPILDSLNQELLHSGFPGDLSVDPSMATTDTSQDLAPGGKPRVLVKLKRAVSKSGDSFPSAFSGTNGCVMEAQALHGGPLFSELSSKDAPSVHKSGTGNFKSDDEIHSNQSISNSSTGRNVRQQCHKVSGEMRNALKPSSFPGIATSSHLDKNVTNEHEIDMNLVSEKVDSFEGGLSIASETLDYARPAENIPIKGSVAYKKPPYTLGHAASLSQKSTEKVPSEYPSQGVQGNTYMENESRVPQTNVSSTMSSRGCNGISSMAGMKMAGSKKPAKALKRNLMGLINDNKKNKVPQLLFPYEDLVKFFQCEVWGISPRGLLNCGNSCYANAVLQCLTCTKPLMVYLLHRLHSRTCWTKDWCLMCELEQHVALLREGGGPLSPSRILSNMRNIGCRMGGGNQEDAHEFLRLLVMSMQSTCLEGLGGEKEVDPRLQETTLIQQMFGGRLQSKVKCLRCHLESERYENIMDLTLEIHGWVESLEDALTQFTAPEDLDGENMYRCGRCAAYVRARKQLSVHEVPNILTIVLKRFQTGKYGKINKCVTFPDMLDMIPFVTGSADKPPLYMLYAVVVHLDTLNASFSGHYVSYVKDLQGTWFRIDDSEVQAVPLSQVMTEGAYMLFYSRSFPRPPRAYIDKAPLVAPTCTKRNSSKTQKPSKHGQDKQAEALFETEESGQLRHDLRPIYRDDMKDQSNDYILRSSSRQVLPADETFSVDFSDATSSDWSLFTSSDESSFTTESTRDSFSTVDYGDNAGLDPISSLFSSFYAPEYSNSNGISCAKLSPSRPQTRFFSESRERVLGSSMPARPPANVHRGRNLEGVRASPNEPSSSACFSGLYGRYGTNPKDGLVQTSGF